MEEKISNLVENIMEGALVLAHITTLVVGIVLLLFGMFALLDFIQWFELIYFGASAFSFGLHWLIRVYMLPAPMEQLIEKNQTKK